jgi:hypothetical protein
VPEARLSPALVVAGCVHAVAALAVALAPRPASSPSGIELAAAPEIDVSLETPPAHAGARGEPAPLAPAAAGLPRETRGVVARVSPAGEAAPAESAMAQALPPPPETGKEPWTFGGRPMDLDVNSYWRRATTESPAAPAQPSASSPSDRVTAILRNGLDERDRDAGLGAAGAFVSAAHEAASGSSAPEAGTATLEIESDAAGAVVAARVVASDGAPGWTGVARDLVRAMSAKRVRVPPGARGVRARLRIVIERAPPSGKKVATNAGAVPDDVPGSEPQCDRGGALGRRCTAGMPAGLSVTGADVANAVGKASRVVRVVALGEERL